MNAENRHDRVPSSSVRSFGVRAAALAGLIVVIGTAVPVGARTTGNETELIHIAEPPNPSTCCGKPPPEDPT